MAPPPRLRRMVEAGLLGRKSGRGFYDYVRPSRARAANGPELTKSLPPQHRVMTARVYDRDMRLPSHQHSRVSRAVALRAALGAPWPRSSLVPAAGRRPAIAACSSPRASAAQVFIGGLGRRRSSTAPSSRAARWSSPTLTTHDMKVESPVPPTTTSTARAPTRPPAAPSRASAFRISGSVFRVMVTGSALNALGVYGRVQLRGKGTLTVDGGKSAGTGPRSSSRRSRRRSAAQCDLAVAERRCRRRPRRPSRRSPPPTTTTTGS